MPRRTVLPAVVTRTAARNQRATAVLSYRRVLPAVIVRTSGTRTIAPDPLR